MGRNLVCRVVLVIVLALALALVCSTSYAPCIVELQLRGDELRVLVSHGLFGNGLMLVAAPENQSLPERSNFEGYADLAEKWGLKEIPGLAFHPTTTGSSSCRFAANIGSVHIPPEHEVLLLYFEDGIERGGESGNEPGGYVSDWAIITELLAEGKASPNRTAKMEVTDISGAGELVMGWILVQVLIWIGIGALFVGAVMILRRIGRVPLKKQ